MKIKLCALFMVCVMLFTCSVPTFAFADDSVKSSSEVTDKTTAESKTEPTTVVTENDNDKDEEIHFGDDVTDEQETQDGTLDENGEPVTKVSEKEAKKTLEEQQKDLAKNLADAEKKLSQLEASSKVTEEYIDTLDQKIGYINEQLTILENQNNEIQKDINELKPLIEKNEKTLSDLSAEVEAAQNELDALQVKFQSIYDAYCYRLKVIYISGDFNIISALISCKDISSFFTRYEMIKSIAKSDTMLLKEVNSKMEEITNMQDGLNAKKSEYEKTKQELDSQKSKLVSKQKTIESNQKSIANKKVSLATDRAESDRLLAELTSQNKQYTEYRNEDSQLIEAVEKEIQSLIAGVKSPDEVTTAVASEKKDFSDIESGGKSDVYSKSDAVLNMTYPVPAHHSISAGYPNYSSGKYHGGIDFPCPTGSKVVAAQDGIVITVKRLNYSYGYYVMIYHGTDASGRSVVTLYAHNSSILVSVGDSVKRGDQIAKSGSTGNSTGPHCHFEVRFNGARANPRNYLS